MQKKRIAINGFGRIGKHTLRILLSRFYDTHEVIAINAPQIGSEDVAYLTNYDSVYGSFEEFDVVGKENFLYVTKEGEGTVHRIQLFDTFDATTLPWKDLDIDVVIDCSGAYKTKLAAEAHIISGAKKMVISSPVKDPEIMTRVIGANAEELHETIFSNASCTTNATATVLSVLSVHDIQFVSGVTAHAYTQSQALLDKEAHKGLREGRAAALNIIPTTTGAASAVEQVLPYLAGKIDLMSLRVPVPAGSVVYLNIELAQDTTSEVINKLFKSASENSHKDILFYTEEELVSSDIVGTPYSGIIDGLSTSVNGKHVRLVVWYDNEWGYTNRLVEMAVRVA